MKDDSSISTKESHTEIIPINTYAVAMNRGEMGIQSLFSPTMRSLLNTLGTLHRILLPLKRCENENELTPISDPVIPLSFLRTQGFL